MEHLENIKHILEKARPELSKRFFVNSIGLFGSVTREDFSPVDSDIDIVVDFTKPVGIEFIDLANYLENLMPAKVDLVSLKGIPPRYLQAIETEIIYV